MANEPVCNNCGKKNNQDSYYCSSCGTQLDTPNKKSPTHKEVKRHSNMIAVGYILSFLFLPAGMVIGLFLISQKSGNDKKNGWIIFGIAFTITFLILFIMLSDINRNLGNIGDQLDYIYYRMGQMRLY